ncbi:Cytochrome monooxygenase lcsI [Penicillium waksmanii]|uniref:Cytochrome monooxygenase lcsI n=1 Tax=Penicillium waksmanii TaxID=69791 RepID=UPI00254659A8|nr:Cytochrome monooxygenase lcsI [Penicillium waksmanii]KAJ5999780.1 Cytochrome monooxygenase lcsI [Penicillium waksmanii]
MAFIVIVAIALAAWLFWTAVYNLYLSPLAKFPGPKLAACTNLQNIYWTLTGQEHYKFKELHDRYGDVVRTGPRSLVYRSPQAWKDIYGHRKSEAGSFLKDPSFYIRGPRGPNIINADDENHSRLRRLFLPAFSERALRDQEDLVQSYVDLLVQRLNGEISASRSTVDLSRWYNFTTFDIIGDLAFGEPFGCLRDSNYHPWVKMIFGSMKLLAMQRPLGIYPFLAPIVRKLTPKKLTKMRQEHFALSIDKVHRRLAAKTERPDFMTYVMRFDDERSMSTQEMEANAAVMIVAGSETTATLLSGLTYYMLGNPSAYQKATSEVRGAFESYSDINVVGVSQLTYLNAAFEEALRVYPPAPGIIPRVVPKGGAAIDGEFIPEGTSVSGAHYSTYHAASHFKHADAFIPERWLYPKDKEFDSDCRAAFQPFSLGPRNCIGQKCAPHPRITSINLKLTSCSLAYAEMRLIAAKILWSFDMSLDESSSEWNVQKSYIVWERKPLLVKLSQVSHNRREGNS